jgi:Skp family chaperone for outer membrane proteins
MDADEMFERHQKEVQEMQQQFSSEMRQMHSEWERDAQEIELEDEAELNAMFPDTTTSGAPSTFEQVIKESCSCIPHQCTSIVGLCYS